ncbi:MAG: tryptophan halogenase family protein [Gammaproteobacteria bacterium]
MNTEVRKVVIAGGGTAGWVAAAALSQQLGALLDITLIESEDIGTVGVGESTVPPMRVFHKLLQIDEQEFMRATAATFKLGILFENWGKIGDRYIHSFGRNGKSAWLCEFHHFWLRGLEKGHRAELGEYCTEWVAAQAGKFATSPSSDLNFAYHIDATLYAGFLRKLAERHGVKRIEGKIRAVNQNARSGFIESLTLDSGKTLEGDLFVDCTGFRGLLIEQTLHTGFEDWSHWLPCDTAVAVQTKTTRPAMPYTSAIAHEAGWRWNIPLQHRVGNGLVYCGRYLSDDEAKNKLLQAVDGETIRQPWLIKIRTGRRRKAWNKNCVSLGLASGFVEPLESTSIHMIMMGVTRLMQLFPFSGIEQSLSDQYNDEARLEIERIRDFIVLHYHTTERDDTPFWRYCRNMEIPQTLARRIQLFGSTAHAFQVEGELFRVDSWTQVMLGQGILPRHYHPMARTMSDADLAQFLQGIRASVAQSVANLPSQADFIDRYCKALASAWEVAAS